MLRQSGDGTEYLELHERDNKTIDASGKEDFRSTVPSLFAVDGPAERCPVALYIAPGQGQTIHWSHFFH